MGLVEPGVCRSLVDAMLWMLGKVTRVIQECLESASAVNDILHSCHLGHCYNIQTTAIYHNYRILAVGQARLRALVRASSPIRGTIGAVLGRRKGRFHLQHGRF
jgi:hypothetical protein